jgi:hypothetical protein
MVSPVSLSAAGVIIAGTAAITLGLARDPAPLPADVVAPMHFTPPSPARATSHGVTPKGRGTSDGATPIPNRPTVFPGPGPGSGPVDDDRADDRGHTTDGPGR